ncbi:MAG: NYN domain-containing protein [Solirubrobacteraceae bacterium]
MAHTRRTLRDGRQLILIDIENLATTPNPTAGEVVWAIGALRRAVPGFDASQRIVACSHRAAPTVAFAFPRARHLWRSGRDGADRALLDVLENEDLDERFERVTICSGDGIFAPVAAWLGGADVDVTVVSLRGHVAARLRLAARHVTLLAPAISTTANRGAC